MGFTHATFNMDEDTAVKFREVCDTIGLKYSKIMTYLMNNFLKDVENGRIEILKLNEPEEEEIKK